MDHKKPIKNLNAEQKRLESFQELFFKYHGRLVLFANKFTEDIEVAQDLVQDAFLKLWEKSEHLSSVDSPKAYLFQAVRNSCINNQRHLHIKHSVKEELVYKLNSMERASYLKSDDPLGSLFEKEIEEKVEKIIQSMPDKCRQVFLLSRREHFKNKQIAQKLSISEKMVEKHISKALALLRAGLSKHLGIVLFAIVNASPAPPT
ncbi:RNA polymerase sigma-70 factor [Maribellus comscasis]|uniref:RNA polymerase sigma-70 factor n=1 Tax=Maribellus comscasis TaxID=2681766 RepID=A0A6I6JL22_9BACT|nr:RNA polymerase sigma-70 factor [Maribellus comscasis]QGY43496.1 RNA polymerase sigma-70 factor [Maribellus comscasis]